jgi:hypothetical protein
MSKPQVSDQEVNRVLQSWLREDRYEDATRVLSAALDEVATTPRRRTTWWPARRTPTMNKFLAIGLGAAAVVAVLLIGSNLLGEGSNPPGGAPSDSIAPSEAPSEAEPSEAAGLPVGSSYEFSGDLPFQATIPAPGWSVDSGILVKGTPTDGAYVLGAWVAPEWFIPSHPCQWESTMPDTPASTLDEIVAALGSQATRNASAPADVTVDGYAGKTITIEMPDGPYSASDNPDCDQNQFCTLGYGDPVECQMWFQEAGQIDELWIIDVDGEFVVVPGSYFPETPASLVDELRTFLGSITFGE